jgi:hypothetical protein
LIPGWLGVVGLILLWISWRGVSSGLQAISGSIGVVLTAGYLLTKKPILIIDTEAGDCHTVIGSEDAMIRLCNLIQCLHDGMGLNEAKSVVQSMISDADYPRHKTEEIIPEPVNIQLDPAPVLTTFLETMQFDDELSIVDERVSEDVSVEDTILPEWFDEVGQETEQQIPNGLISRAITNNHTQRHNVANNGWQPPQNQPVAGVHRNQMVDASSFGMLNHHAGYQPNYSEPLQQSPPPTNFLPSFVGINGAHVPGSLPEEFSSPDTPLPIVEEEEQVSLVASIRKDSEILDAEVIDENQLESPKERYPGMSRLTVKPKKRRIKTSKNRNRRLSAGSVVRELVGGPLDRASALSRRFLPRRRRTTDALRLQAQNARQEQVADSIQNLAKSRGGEVSDAEVSAMMSHIQARPDIPDSFDELVSTDKNKSEQVEVEHIPRLDS